MSNVDSVSTTSGHSLASEFYSSKNGNCQKLNATNYRIWKEEISFILTALKAINIVTGVELPPRQGNTVAARTLSDDFQARSVDAAIAILFSCSNSIRIHIRGITDPKIMWDTLATKLDTTSSHIGRATILNNFVQARPHANESIVDYLAVSMTSGSSW